MKKTPKQMIPRTSNEGIFFSTLRFEYSFNTPTSTKPPITMKMTGKQRSLPLMSFRKGLDRTT